jgi:hypothetical protein
MDRRELHFETYDDIRHEIERLEAGGCEPLGRWNLGQTCWHLNYYLRGSLEGYPKMFPWLLRATLGRYLLKKVLSGKPWRTGGQTIPGSVPPAAVDEAEAIGESKQLLTRLKAPVGGLHPSPLFGQLTEDQCRMLHCRHAAHHLGFLVPKP